MNNRTTGGIGLRMGIAIAVLVAATTAAQGQAIDFSKLKKGDKLEINVEGKWVAATFDKQHTEKVIIVRREGVDLAQIVFANMARLPEGSAKGVKEAGHKPRSWSDRTGKFKLYATLVRVEGDKVVLKRSQGGKEIAVAIEKLCESDQKYIKSLEAKGKPPAAADAPEAAKANQPPDASKPALAPEAKPGEQPPT
jgi:hypothetical protein